MWRPPPLPSGPARGPRYRAIAEAIAADVARGALAPGTRLPPQRDLARALGVTVGTVMRAYARAAELGLVRGEVGRGTFVQGAGQAGEGEAGATGPVDLGMSLPPAALDPGERRLFAEGLRGLAAAPELSRLLSFEEPGGLAPQREAAAAWLGAQGVPAEPERVVLTVGAQHGLFCAAAATLRAGDVLLVEELTYPGVRSVANALGLELHGVSLDEEGLMPDALEAACAAHGRPRALYTVPTLQNPTSSVLPRARREAVAAIARRHDLVLIEDDVYGPLAARRPAPLAALAPERTWFVTSLSKTVAAGLRLGVLHAPPERAGAALEQVWATAICAPPPLAALAARWMADGTVEGFVARRRAEARARQALLREHLGALPLRTSPESYNALVELPAPWTAADFVARARERGVLVSPAATFAADPARAPRAVRLGLISPPRRERLAEALRTLAELALGEPAAARVL